MMFFLNHPSIHPLIHSFTHSLIFRQYYQACIAEGQTHLSLGTLHLHLHTLDGYNQAQREYEAACSCFLAAGDHIDNHFLADARQNLKVLSITKKAMQEYRIAVQRAEEEENNEKKLVLWKGCCEDVLKFEQFVDETPFIQYQNMSEKCHGKNSHEFASSVHLYAEFLYTLYCASEDPTKLNQALRLLEVAIGRVWVMTIIKSIIPITNVFIVMSRNLS